MNNPQSHTQAVELAETLVAIVNSVTDPSSPKATRNNDKITAHLPYVGEVQLRTRWGDDTAGFHLTEVCGTPADRHRSVFVNQAYPVEMQDVVFKILPILCHEARMAFVGPAAPQPVANPALAEALTELRAAAEQFDGTAAGDELTAVADGIEAERAEQLDIPATMSEDEVLALIAEVSRQVGTEHGQLAILTAVVNTAIHRHRIKA